MALLLGLAGNYIFRPVWRSLADGHLLPYRIEQTWTYEYNPNLIGQDRLPPGKQTFDLTPRPHEYHVLLRSWQWSYNRNLVGKDQLPVGEQTTDLVPRIPAGIFQQWLNTVNLALIAPSKPFAQYDWPLTPAARPIDATWLKSGNALTAPAVDTTKIFRGPLYTQHVQPSLLQTWIQSVNLTLAGPPQKPTAQYDWPLTPAAIQPERTIAASYNKNLIGQDRLPTGEQVFELAPSQRPPEQIQLHSWVWRYALQLIGQDKLPTGEQTFELTPRDPREARDWRWSYNLNLIGKDVLPFRQTDWPLTPAAQQPERTVAASYNKNLIAQDAMVTGQQVTDLPPRDFARLFQTWINTVNLSLITAPPDIHALARQMDWPLPTQPSRLDQTWAASYNKNLVGQDQLPFRQSDWPNPVQPAQVKDWIQSTNLVLTAAPIRPFVQSDWPLPSGPAPLVQTWFNTISLALTLTKPFAQYDWPLTSSAQQPERSITASYLKTLIGQDRLPTGVKIYDLWPAGPQQPDRGFGISFNLNLRGQDQLPNRQTDWPFPIGPQQPDRGFSFNPSIGLYFQPLTLPLSASRILELAPFGYPPLLQQSVYEYNTAFIPVPSAPTLILRTLMGTGL